jgi:ACS family hexuronate transporter-like MFS transporter
MPFLTDSAHSKLGYRWTICALLFAATTINYLDRQVLSVLAPDLQKSMGWSERDYGHIVFGFQLAYMIALPLAGRLIDRVGTRMGYASFVTLWSLVSMSHVFARSVLGFGLARFALGFAEAGNFPAAIKTVAEWFPKKERALAIGIFNSGAMVGAIIAPAIVPWLASQFGWQTTFIVISSLGFIWLFLWMLLYHPPQKCRYVHASELAYIQSDQAEESTRQIPWVHLLRHRGVWAFVVGKLLSDPIWWFFLFWLPKFLAQQYNCKVADMATPLVVIYGVSAIGSISGGWVCSRLISRGWSLTAARKGVMLGCALAVVPVLLAVTVHSFWLAIAVISLATAAHCGWMANLFALVSDIFPRQVAGSITGLGGMAGALGGMCMAEFAGSLLQATGSYWPLFAVAASSYLLGWGIIHLLVPKIEAQSIDAMS